MKAIRVHRFGGPEVLRLEEVPNPKPGPGQVVVGVKAIGVNPADTYIRAGTYPRKPSLPKLCSRKISQPSPSARCCCGLVKQIFGARPSWPAFLCWRWISMTQLWILILRQVFAPRPFRLCSARSALNSCLSPVLRLRS